MRKKRFRNSVVEHILSVLIIITAPWHFYNTIEFEQHSLQGLLKTNASLLLSKPLDADSKYQTHSAQPGESLTDALKYFNIALPTIQKYQRKLRSEGFASLSQGDSLVFTQNLFQNVTIVSILNNLNTWYHLYNHADGTITIEKKPVKLTTYRCMVKGSLTSTITHDLSKLGLSDVLVSKLADIFAWDINFITDPQIGDSFVMIFETMYCDGRFIDFGSILAAKYVNQTKSYYAFGIRDTFAQMHYFDINGRPLKKQFLRSPVRLSKLTSEFSLRRRHPIYGVIRPHLGIDLAAPVGTPVYAAADGIINSIGRVQGYGLQIRLNHGTSVETYYGHLHDIAPGITKEQTIKQGQLIGFVGSTGDATGPHLDYRIKLNGEFCNPEMLKSGVVEDYIINSENTAVFEQTKQTYLALIDNRLNRSGCYVLEITVPQIDSTILAKTSFPPIPHS